MGLYREGVRQAKESSEIVERIGSVIQQAQCLIYLARVLRDDGQLSAAKEAGSRAIDLLPEKGEEFWVCRAHRILGNIYRSKRKMKKAVHHFEAALGIASSIGAIDQLFWVNYSIAEVFSAERKFGNAQTHIERTKSLAVNNTYLLARVSLLQAQLWYAQDMLGEAKSEALHALDELEKLGDEGSSEFTRRLLHRIEAWQSVRPWRFKWRR